MLGYTLLLKKKMQIQLEKRIKYHTGRWYYCSIENNYFWGEHKGIKLKQQFLGIVLGTFYAFKWPWLLRIFV